MTTELMQFLLPYFEKLVLGLDIFAICLFGLGCLSINQGFFEIFICPYKSAKRPSQREQCY